MTLFQCPVCQQLLVADEQRYICENNHSFDRAREGYVNLLLANQKKSKNPGDSREMIQSRAAFLSAGHYAPLASAMVAAIGTYHESPSSLLDIGCGEGYYLNACQQTYADTLTCYGMDISKEAAKLAARQSDALQIAVASVANIPVQSNCVDVLLNVFSPRNLPEMARIATDDALLLCITPAEGHLQELRQRIYDTVYPYQSLADDAFAPYFSLVDVVDVRYSLALESGKDITHLLQMTPFYWHISQETQRALLSLSQLDLTISFGLSVWRYHAGRVQDVP